MRPRYFKMPDGRLAKSRATRLEQYLRDNQPPPAAAGGFTTSRPSSRPYRQSEDGSADVDFDRLSGYEIVLFGTGSVGSYLAGFLAIVSFILHVVDFKRVEPKHLKNGRTIYTPEDLGLFKVEALKRRIEADHPGTQVRAYPCNVAQFTESDLTALFRRCLVVLLAIDDPEQLVRIADLAYPLVELLQAAMHARGHSSHLICTIPGRTACLRCALEIRNPNDIRRLDSEPSASGHIVTLANTAANFALDLAYSKVTGQPITRWDITKNLIYIANTTQPISPDGPGLHYEGSQRRPGCPICNPLP